MLLHHQRLMTHYQIPPAFTSPSTMHHLQKQEQQSSRQWQQKQQWQQRALLLCPVCLEPCHLAEAWQDWPPQEVYGATVLSGLA
jgi:hypothetical protein